MFSLVLGVLLFPLNTNAGFFSSLLGTEVIAEESVNIENSQNIPLLEANISPLTIITGEKDLITEIAVDTTNISQDALVSVIGPVGTSDTEEESFSFSEISIYVVRKGDNVSNIAKMFGVSSDTILWANDLSKNEKLKEGDTLIILPIDGTIYSVRKGDTIAGIAKSFGVTSKDIYEFNGLDPKEILSINTELIIPGAEVKTPTKSKKSTSSSYFSKRTKGKTNVKTGGRIPNNFYSSSNSKNYKGYYIKPIPCGLTQGKHGRYAVDMSCGYRTPIKASASGTVIFAKYGWNGAYGNLVIIEHPNGTQTFYAHMSKIKVSLGDWVKQGQIIGKVGNTGRSTGPHVHFEVRGAKNPGFDNSWAR